jgi:hypothetical protein
MVQGSNTVTLLDDIDLQPGSTRLPAPSIGETDDLSGGIMFVSSAWFDYTGSPDVSMFIHVSVDGVVGYQEVTATSTGTYSLRIEGTPGADWYSITGIPAGALATLTTGLRYNISGNGIQVGSTFVADSAATSITLGPPPATSAFGAIPTITGRAPRTRTRSGRPNREDEEITPRHQPEEGGFATLTVDIRNPNIGLLAFGRNPGAGQTRATARWCRCSTAGRSASEALGQRDRTTSVSRQTG